ncbi:MAG: 50S ribosomal protein L35 [Armatimonadota bacterium]
MKTKQSAAKRCRITRRGKVMIKHARTKHLLSGKTRRRKRRLSRPGKLTGADARNMRRLIAHK